MPEFLIDHKFKEIIPPFPSVASYMVFCGKSRSGKSSLITALLTNPKMYKRAFHNIIICIPYHSFRSMKESDNPFKDLDEEKIFHDLSIVTLETIYSMVQHFSSEEMDSLLILDDFASELKNNELLKMFNMLINNRRHLRLSIWMSVQTYLSIPLSNRKTINFLVLFKCSNKREINSIWEEMSFLTKENFYELLKFVFDRPFEYLVLDRDNNQYYKKFSEIIVKEENVIQEKDESKN